MSNWSAEQWSRRGMIEHSMIGHSTTGVLTSYGLVLHEPVGRINWAGTERTIKMHGRWKGAVPSGEKAAQDILDQNENAARVGGVEGRCVW